MAGKTNPNGGGGDQFRHIFVQRQGEYGVHQTVSGKIVYQRPRHYFSSGDLMRILPKVAEQEEKVPPVDGEGWTWWEKAVNWLADWMLSKIVALANLSEGFAQVAWSWMMTTWEAFLVKLMPGDPWAKRTHTLYAERLRKAIISYTDNGDLDLAETLWKDISGIKE